MDSSEENNDDNDVNIHIFVPMIDGDMQPKGRSMHQNNEKNEIIDGKMNQNHGDEMTDGEMQSKGQSMHLHYYEGNDTRVNN